MQMPQMAKDVFMGRFIASSAVTVKPHRRANATVGGPERPLGNVLLNMSAQAFSRGA
jgi:hypothetical protein